MVGEAGSTALQSGDSGRGMLMDGDHPARVPHRHPPRVGPARQEMREAAQALDELPGEVRLRMWEHGARAERAPFRLYRARVRCDNVNPSVFFRPPVTDEQQQEVTAYGDDTPSLDIEMR